MNDSNNQMYNEDFYNLNYKSSYDSAKEVVPIIMKRLRPKSVVDLGCGSGTWLKVFQQNKVDNLLGIDFHNERTIIPNDIFLKYDLRKQLKIERRFDLAISLEVAEHIETKYSELFVKNLTQLSNVILFSAAIPKQEGENHINEQWHNYWIKLFQKKGYVAIDFIRPHILLNEKVSMDYRQNMILFVNKETLQKNPTQFINYFDKSKQLLFRKCYAKQLSYKYRVIYRINNQVFKGLFNGFVDKLFLKRFFGDMTSANTTKEGIVLKEEVKENDGNKT